MSNQNHLLNAIEMVLAWDLPDEVFSEAVKAPACQMAGISPEEFGVLCLD